MDMLGEKQQQQQQVNLGNKVQGLNHITKKNYMAELRCYPLPGRMTKVHGAVLMTIGTSMMTMIHGDNANDNTDNDNH